MSTVRRSDKLAGYIKIKSSTSSILATMNQQGCCEIIASIKQFSVVGQQNMLIKFSNMHMQSTLHAISEGQINHMAELMAK